MIRRLGTPVAALMLTLTMSANASAAAQNADPGPLTLADAVARALDAYPALAAARARFAAAEEATGEARNDRGPRLYATLDGLHYREPVPITPIHGFGIGAFPEFDDTLVQAGFAASYTLVDSGVRREKVRQAAARSASERAALGAGEQQIVARVAALYAEVLARRTEVEAQRSRLESVRAELVRVSQLLAVGKAPEVDRLRAEAALAAAEAESTAAATGLATAEGDLARLTGLPADSLRGARLVATAEPLAPALDGGALAAAAVAGSPEVERARAAVAAADAAHGLARTAYFPRLAATGGYQELSGSAFAFSSEWNVGLRLTVPLWDGGVTDRRVAQASAQQDLARAQLAQAELDARQAADHALARFSDAAAQAAALERAEARLAEVARIQKLLLEVGSGTQIDYLAAESDLAATRAALARTRSAALAARVELARTVGELDLDWLVANLETRR